MTHVVDTGVATLRHNQNHPGSVPVPARGVPACSASENSVLESEGLLGSRETPRTRHGRVRGPHQHHLPAGPPAPLDQLPFRRPDRRVRGLTSHRRPRQKPRPEILHRNQLMVVDHTFRPHPRLVPVPARGLRHDLRRVCAGAPVALRRRVALPAAARRGTVNRPFARQPVPTDSTSTFGGDREEPRRPSTEKTLRTGTPRASR